MQSHQLKKLYNENLQYQKQLNNSSQKSSVNQQSKQQTSQILNKMQNIDNKMAKYSQTNQILALNAQNIILQITENSHASDLNSIEFYKAMISSASNVIYLLKKCINSIK